MTKGSGLPRTYMQVGDKDSVRDDGVIYVKALQDLGVEARVDVIPCGHDAFTVFTNDQSHPELGAKSTAGMAWLLRQ